MSSDRKAGDQIGPWHLRKRLGRGGNAEVWLAAGPGGEVALKILYSRDSTSEPYRRFVAEVQILRGLGTYLGILPILSFELPDAPSRQVPAWLAMPVATPIRVALGEESTLQEVVAAIHPIAQTLAGLAEREIFHRDIKPDNLYWFEDSWCVGDFGLAEYPSKEALTVDGRRLGPLYYHAPECLFNPSAAGKPADVYSLAKTLWVLATGQSYPYPGPLEPEQVEHRLSTYCTDENTRPLDLLIGRATYTDSSKRPPMARFATELGAWLAPTARPSPPELGDELKARIAQITRPHRAILAERARRNERAGKLIDMADTALQETILPAIRAAGLEFHGGSYNIFEAVSELRAAIEGDNIRSGGARYTIDETMPRGINTKRLSLTIGIWFAANHYGKTLIVPFLALYENASEVDTVWSDTRIVDTESAEELSELVSVVTAIKEWLPVALQRFLERIEVMREQQ